jgi:hypothetical protein
VLAFAGAEDFAVKGRVGKMEPLADGGQAQLSVIDGALTAACYSLSEGIPRSDLEAKEET